MGLINQELKTRRGDRDSFISVSPLSHKSILSGLIAALICEDANAKVSTHLKPDADSDPAASCRRPALPEAVNM